jgi:hypothetical protein
MAIHTLRVIKGGRTLLRKQVSEGLGVNDAISLRKSQILKNPTERIYASKK